VARILLFSHTTGYQLRAFNDAAEQLGVQLLFATDRCHLLDDPWQDQAIPVRFYDVSGSLNVILEAPEHRSIEGVIAVGDRPIVLAARAAEALGIPWHSVAGALASADKRRSRTLIAGAGLPSPPFVVVPVSERTIRNPESVGFPCVLKPVGLSGSRGVIRADNPEQFAGAVWRIRALLSRPQIRSARAGLEDEILVEAFIPGFEVALEGALTHGRLTTFAIFDKPDPLDGPFFEETIYVTPSRLPESIQEEIIRSVEQAAGALGLTHGPVHAECRVNEIGVYVIEVAARPIGGLCSRVLTFVDVGWAGADMASLERVLLAHARGDSIAHWTRESRAAAVMMIPIPRRGVLKGIHGEDQARIVRGVDEIRITAKLDQLLEPLPEAGSYLGFIFARGATPGDAERAVREAHAKLTFEIEREIEVI
jgi:biotin carboxylase